MIFLGNGNLKLEKNEPTFRSCWNCNSAHEQLKKLNMIMNCFICGKNFIFGREMNFKNDKEFDKFFKNYGLKKGDSTTKVDLGYRITVLTISPSKSEAK